MQRARKNLAIWLGMVAAGCQEPAELTRPGAASPVSAQILAVGSENVATIDHQVPHVSTVSANFGELVHLFVRERGRTEPSNAKPREAVLMIHGRSIPVLAVTELRHGNYDWAHWLARSGDVDVFMLDFQGSGRAPRPKVDDPCNVPTAQEGIQNQNTLSATCPSSHPL